MTITEQGPNHELFVEVLAQIEREPQKWSQDEYRRDPTCGTAYCFAGWAIALTGIPWVDGSRLFVNYQQGEVAAPAVAADLLGLDGEYVDEDDCWTLEMDGQLFAPDNTLDDLYRISADILAVDETVLRDKVRSEVES